MKSHEEVMAALAMLDRRMLGEKMREDQRMVLCNMFAALCWVVELHSDVPNAIELLLRGAKVNSKLSDAELEIRNYESELRQLRKRSTQDGEMFWASDQMQEMVRLAMRLARLEMDLPPYPDGQHPPLWRRARTGVGRFIPGQGYQQTAMEMSSSVGSLAGTTRHLRMLARSLFFADALINRMAPADAEAALATRYEVGKAIIGLTGRPDLCGNQIYFNVRVFGSFDASSSAVLRELDESDRFVQKSAESTSI